MVSSRPWLLANHAPYRWYQVVCVRVGTSNTSAIVKLLGAQLALPNLKYLKRVRRVAEQTAGSRDLHVDVLLGPRADVDKMTPVAYEKVQSAHVVSMSVFGRVI